MRRTAPLAALAIFLLAPSALADPDPIPDEIEPILCSIEAPSNDIDGTCRGNDYSLPSDGDGDGAPDAVEAQCERAAVRELLRTVGAAGRCERVDGCSGFYGCYQYAPPWSAEGQ